MKHILKFTRALHKKATNLHIGTLRRAMHARGDYTARAWEGARVAQQMAEAALDRALQVQAQTDNFNQAARLEVEQLGAAPE